MYWEIPFWINAYSAIYLQILKYKQNGKNKQFLTLAKEIIGYVVKLSKKDSEEDKAIRSIIEDNEKYQFDGD